MMHTVQINVGNMRLLENFLENAGNSLKSFRYFKKRPLSVIKQHLVTYLLLKDDQPVAYGHLDMENGTVWLGIAVSESEQGQGFGKKMMNTLLSFANSNNIKRIDLSVDKTNSSAIQLYESHQFKLKKEEGEIAFFTLEIP